eukprot:PhM_4_TR9141/c0_g1_i2/m.90221
MMIFMVFSRFCKTLARSSFAYCSGVAFFVKFMQLSVAGEVHYTSPMHVATFVVMGLFAFPGIYLGNRLHHTISPRVFSYVILFLLMVSSLVLLAAPVIVLLCVVGTWVVGAAGVVLFQRCYLHRGYASISPAKVVEEVNGEEADYARDDNETNTTNVEVVSG